MLRDSRKVKVALLAALGAALSTYFDNQELAAAVTLLGMTLMGGIAHEDAAEKSARK